MSEYKKFSPEQTTKYVFCHVESFAKFVRVDPDSRPSIVIRNLRKVHSISYQGDGILAKNLSCIPCCTAGEVCHICENLAPTVKQARVEKAIVGVQFDDEHYDEEEEMQSDYELDSDNGSDVESEVNNSDTNSSTDSEDDEDQFSAGNVIWAARYRKKIPALVVSLEDIPEPRQKVLKTRKPGMLYVEYIGLGTFSVVSSQHVIRLAANPIDMQLKKNTTADIYQRALEMSM